MGATPNWIAEMTPRGSQSQTNDDELWIDGCGGFRLAVGSRWQIGGPDMETSDPASSVIRVLADVPRIAGELVRNENDYVWLADGESGIGGEGGAAKPVLIGAEHPVPMVGSARMFLTVPSPLSPSAVLTLQPPHRFGGHVDGVVLATDTVLLGPGRECHVRCGELSQRYVLSLVTDGVSGRASEAGDPAKGHRWKLIARGKPPIEMIPNQRLTIDDVSMTLVRPR